MRSDNVTKGSERAPNRSLFYALGYTPEELERPLIGVVSAYSEIVPGHMNLDKIAEAVKAGVQMAGGTPILIPAIGVCDGIAMGHVGMKYSLASRELICDSVETMLMAHQLDGLVLVPNCVLRNRPQIHLIHPSLLHPGYDSLFIEILSLAGSDIDIEALDRSDFLCRSIFPAT